MIVAGESVEDGEVCEKADMVTWELCFFKSIFGIYVAI